MRDCANANMRDVLPDLLHGQVSAELRASVQAHLDSCDACRDELALLRRVRAAAPAPSVDADRIAAAVPAYSPAWRRTMSSPLLRIAAAVVLVAGGATLLRDAPRRAPDSAAVVATGGTVPASELAVGDQLADLSEQDLRVLLGEIGDMEAVTSDETDVIVVPGLDERGGA